MQSWAIQYFSHAISRRPISHQRVRLREFFDSLTLEQVCVLSNTF